MITIIPLKWCENRNINTIEQAVSNSLDHWRNIAAQMIVLHQQDAEKCSAKIEALVNNNHI